MRQPSDRLPADWPNREHSRFVRAAGLVWHVQVAGSGPVLLMLHGTGAATHSWRDLLPDLASHFTVVAPDLPGHGFTEAPAIRRLSLPGMARDLQALLWALDVKPAVVAGHSAGVAIGVRMCLDGKVQPRLLVGLNAALLPLGGVAGQIFSPLARLLAGLPGLPDLFAWRARNPATVAKLLRDTGSTLDARGVALYAQVVREPQHAAAALGMMAQWDLQPLENELPGLATRLLLVVGDGDRTVPPADSARVRDMTPDATLVSLPGLGHLAHEEAPARTVALIVEAAREAGVLA